MAAGMLVPVMLVVAMLVGFIWMVTSTTIRENRCGSPNPKLVDFAGFLGIPVLALVWFILFSMTDTKYSTKTYKSVTAEGRDFFYTENNNQVNLNRLLGRRVDAGSTVEAKDEVSRLGLVWSEKTSYSLKDKDGSSNNKD